METKGKEEEEIKDDTDSGALMPESTALLPNSRGKEEFEAKAHPFCTFY